MIMSILVFQLYFVQRIGFLKCALQDRFITIMSEVGELTLFFF